MMQAITCWLLSVTALSLLTGCDEGPLKSGNLDDIAALIQEAQHRNVKASRGVAALQCFSEIDYKRFQNNQCAKRIAERMKGKRKFMEAILALKFKTKTEQESFLYDCRRPLRPTWAQLGRISSDGQTEAGQRAELDIANAIVDAAAELCALSDEELFTVFKKH